MSNYIPGSYTYSFQTSVPTDELFAGLLNVGSWWSGLYGETITGSSRQPGDVFTFSAGGGAHVSEQKLVELIPGQKIAWLVTDANLSFLTRADEWKGTHICFDLASGDGQTTVTFAHDGLVPKIECYNGCAGAWTKYMEQLEAKLK